MFLMNIAFHDMVKLVRFSGVTETLVGKKALTKVR